MNNSGPPSAAAGLRWTGGREPYDYTDIDRTVAAGLSLTGKRWGRPSDTFGLAGIVNAATALSCGTPSPFCSREGCLHQVYALTGGGTYHLVFSANVPDVTLKTIRSLAGSRN
jgi:hypothetical protein